MQQQACGQSFLQINRGNGAKKGKVAYQTAAHPTTSKQQPAKAAQAKSFMLREKDVQFKYSYQQPPGRLSVSKPPASIVSRDSSSENIQFHDEEEGDMASGDNEANHRESPLRLQ